jgi:hypothetical protein
MEIKEMEYHERRLKRGEIYFNIISNEKVEYKYLGQTGLAIVCEPGDSGGGMQSSWGTNPNNLEFIVDETTR